MSLIKDNDIPLVDADDDDIVDDSEAPYNMKTGASMDSIPSYGSDNPAYQTLEASDVTPDEQEEKARLISQVLELQNTLDDLSQRVDSVKEENLKLKSENQVLNQYIENLMSASSVFSSTGQNNVKKK